MNNTDAFIIFVNDLELSLLHYIFIHKVFFKERGVVGAGRVASGPKEHFSNKIYMTNSDQRMFVRH